MAESYKAYRPFHFDPGDRWHVDCERCEMYTCPPGECYPTREAAKRARRLHMRWHNRKDGTK